MLIVKRQRLAVILSADGLHSAADLNSRALTSARFSDRGVSDVRELRRRAPEELRRAAGAGKRGSLPAPAYLIGGNFSVRVTREGRDWFVWKKEKLEVTTERLAELERFAAQLSQTLIPVI
jgi:hypothetical protein